MTRRGSVVGPLVLIGIGVLFLMRNMYPEMRILEFLSRSWPWVLVAWGALRLVELFVWNSQGKPLPHKGVSGGEWAFIIFFSIFGSALSSAFKLSESDWWAGQGIRINGWEFGNEPHEFPIEAKAASGKTPRLVIESFRGDAQIVGADVEEIRVTGRKVIRSARRERAEELDKKTPVELVNEGTQIVLRLNQQRNTDDNSRQSARLEILVPRGTTIDAKGRYGDFDIRDVAGAVRIDSDNAGVRLESIGGDVTVDTRRSDIIRMIGVTGSVDLRGRGDDVELEKIQGNVTINGGYTGTVQLRELAKPVRYQGRELQFGAEKVAGEIRSSVGSFAGENLAGPVKVKAGRSWDVQLTDFTDAVEVDVARGNVQLRPKHVPMSRLDVQTANGDIDLFVPEQAKFEIKAVARRGEVTSEFDALKPAEKEEGRTHTLEGAIGAGPKVSLETGRGTINLWKRSSAEVPDAPAVKGTPKPPTPQSAPVPPPPSSAPVKPAPPVPPVRVI